MPVIGIAEVLVSPVFSGLQQKVGREVGKTMPKMGKDAGQQFGKGMADGFSAETAGLEAEVGKLAKSVANAEANISASKQKMAEASAAESKALGELRVAELKLQELRDNSKAKASQVAAAEEKLGIIRHSVAVATERRETAEHGLVKSNAALTSAQEASSKASAELESHMKNVGTETEKTEKKVRSFSTMLNGLFQDNPLSRLTAGIGGVSEQVKKHEAAVATAAENIEKARRREEDAAAAVRVAETRLSEARKKGSDDSAGVVAAQERLAAAHRRVETAQENSVRSMRNLESAQDRLDKAIRSSANAISVDLHKMAQDVSTQGTRGGRAFTRGFVMAVGGLSAITPTVGAAGSALLAAAGAATTFAGSLTALGGVAALIPAGMIAIGAGAGVLIAAFSGMGDALKAITDQQGAFTADPRLAAMAVEDASRAIVAAEENAARASEDAARRVTDAKRALTDTIAAVADAEENAAEAIESATRRVVDAKRSLQDAVRAAADAEESAAEAQESAARRVRDAKFALQDTIERVAESQQRAARAVEEAERRQAEATREVVAAQKALVEAREKAAARVAEVAQKVSAADTKAIDTTLALQRAQEAYNRAKADPKTSQLQLAQLQNNAAKAAAADEAAKRAVVELRGEHKTAQAEAKKGNEAVISAEEKLAKARQAEADALQARKDAEAKAVKEQRDGARQIARAQEAISDALKDQKKAHRDAGRAAEDAARRVTDAQQNVTDSIKDEKEAREDAGKVASEGARRIADAQMAVKDATRDATQTQKDSARAVEQAHRNLERIQLQQADAAAKAGHDSAEAMGNLTPAAQTAVRALLAVKDQLSGIRRIAQENFFAGFSAPLLALAGTVMPQLATGVGAIASAFGEGAQIFMGALDAALGNGVLETLLFGVADTVTALNGAIKPMVDSFVTLGVVGMDYMPRLGEAIADMFTRFDNFIQTAAADGSLVAWIDAGIEGIKDLGSIIGSVVGIFGALNEAAVAGGVATTLGGLADGLDRIEATMQGPVFQKTMTTIFEGAAGGMRGMAEAGEKIADAFVRGAPALADFLRLGGEIIGTFVGGVFTALSDPKFGAGLTTFMEGLKAGVEEISPLLPGLTDAFGRILTAAAPIVRNLGPSLIEVFTFFADTIGFVMEMLGPLLTALADSPIILGLLIGAFTATAAASAALTAAGNVQKIAMGLWAGATKAWTAITKLATLAQKGMNAAMKANPILFLVGLVTLLVGALVWLYNNNETARKIMDAAWKGIQAAVKWAWEKVIKPAVDAMVKFFREVLAPTFKWFYESIVKPVWGWISSAIKWAWEKVIQPAFAAIKWYIDNILTPVFRWFRDHVIKPVWDGISSFISNVWEKKIKPVFKVLGDFIRDKVAPAWQKGVDAIKSIFETIREIAAKPINFVIDAVYNNGLRKAINAVRKVVGGKDLPEMATIGATKRSTSGGPMRAFAKGGFAAPGWALVGEEGPELVNFSNPGRVYTADQSKEMLGAGHGPSKKGLPAMGGWAADAWESIKAGARKATDWVRGALASTAGFILNPIKDKLGGLIPGGNTIMGDLAKKASTSAIDKALDWIRGKDEQEIPTGSTAAVFDGPLGKFHRPSRGPYTSMFGPRPGFGDYHTGVDIAGGGPTFAALNGIVSQIGNDPVGGIFIRLNHGKGFSTYYGHNPVGGPKVNVGQKVRAGQPIGQQGMTGLATGVHVHFQTEKNGTPVNPMAYLHDQGGVLNPGLSTILNNTGKPEAILNQRQWQDIHSLATRGQQSAPQTVLQVGNMFGSAEQIVNEIDTRRRREINLSNLRSI